MKIAVTPEYEDEKRQFHSNRLLLFLLLKKLTAISDIFFIFWKLCTWLFTLHNLHARKKHTKTSFSRFLIFSAYKLFWQEKKIKWNALCEIRTYLLYILRVLRLNHYTTADDLLQLLFTSDISFQIT